MMIWRLKRLFIPSVCFIVLSFTTSERKANIERLSRDSLFIFKTSDEELHRHKRAPLSVSSELEAPKHKNRDQDLIKDGIFWSDYAESFVPKGVPYNDSMELVKKFRHQHVKNITNAKQSVCGSGKNGIVELEDGTNMCARYEKNQYLIFAEALAFYLSRLLGMDNVPEIVLSKTDESSDQWKGSDFQTLNWKENVEVALIKWLQNASSETFMPMVIQNAYRTGKPVNSDVIHYTAPLYSRHSAAIAELIQWGTMIIFDNLIGHYDRLILYQPVGKREISRRSITSGLYNSLKSPNGKIWLIDNESAFFYQNKYRDPAYNYIQLLNFHDKMLKTMCIFQSSLVIELRKLSNLPSPFHHLWMYASTYEPLFVTFKKDYRFNEFARFFNKRLDDIIDWIDHCKAVSFEK